MRYLKHGWVLSVGILTILSNMASGDVIELQNGQKVNGRVLGVTDGIFHYMEEKAAGISISASASYADIKSFSIQNPALEVLRQRVRDLERENKLQQEQLDLALDKLADLSSKLTDLNQKAARLRTTLDQMSAARPVILPPTQTFPVSVPRQPTPTPRAAPEPVPTSAANVVARGVAAERNTATGMTVVSGRLFNTGSQAARWIKVQIHGISEEGVSLIQTTAYSTKPILEPGESAEFNATLKPPPGTLSYNVQVEWN